LVVIDLLLLSYFVIVRAGTLSLNCCDLQVKVAVESDSSAPPTPADPPVQTMVTGHQDGSIKLWNVDSGSTSKGWWLIQNLM
jgi:hypothetical protein